MWNVKTLEELAAAAAATAKNDEKALLKLVAKLIP